MAKKAASTAAAKKTTTAAPATKASAKPAGEFGGFFKKMAGAWKKARAAAASKASGGIDLPVGAYICILKEASILNVSGVMKALFKFAVAKGEFAGKEIPIWQGLSTEEDLVWFGVMLLKFGIDAEQLNDDEIEQAISGLAEAMNGTAFRVRVTEKDGWTNGRLDKIIEGAEVEAEAQAEAEEETEAEEGVDLDSLDRAGLKAFIKENELDVKVLKNDSDDQLREKIKAALPEEEEAEEEEEEEEAEEEAEEEEEAEAEEEEGVSVAVGSKVEATYKGKAIKGTIHAIDEQAGTLKIKPDAGQAQTKIFTVAAEQVEAL